MPQKGLGNHFRLFVLSQHVYHVHAQRPTLAWRVGVEHAEQNLLQETVVPPNWLLAGLVSTRLEAKKNIND